MSAIQKTCALAATETKPLVPNARRTTPTSASRVMQGTTKMTTNARLVDQANARLPTRSRAHLAWDMPMEMTPASVGQKELPGNAERTV